MSRRRPRIPGTRHPQRLLFVLPAIPDELPPEFKNALAIRNACAVEGACPSCGVEGDLLADADFEGVWHYIFRHKSGCSVLLDGAAA